jgi:hypothetical protein
VEYIDLLPPLIDTINNAIEMWLFAIEQVPEPLVFGCYGTAIGLLRQAQNRLLETLVPLAGGGRIGGIDPVVERNEIAFSS